MYVAHDAFHQDLRRLAAAVDAGRAAEPSLRVGRETFKEQLHIHHTAEDVSVWPALRAKVTMAGHVAVLDAMEAEHGRIDAPLGAVDSCLAAADQTGLAENADGLATALAAHMEHEEDQALPLVETFLGPVGWAAFAQEMRRTQGLRGAAEFFPWMLDDAPRAIRKRVLGLLPARLLYRAVWAPGYARTRRWDAATT